MVGGPLFFTFTAGFSRRIITTTDTLQVKMGG